MTFTDRNFLKARILLQNYFFAESLNEIEQIIKKNGRVENEIQYNPKWLESSQETVNQLAIKHWETTKQSMNQWDDLVTISKGTERQFVN